MIRAGMLVLFVVVLAMWPVGDASARLTGNYRAAFIAEFGSKCPGTNLVDVQGRRASREACRCLAAQIADLSQPVDVFNYEAGSKADQKRVMDAFSPRLNSALKACRLKRQAR